ncbi:uncharacterized protein LOC134543010 [Bacillus rossius redtenbacheri]|uniref:uncharacterized protein LOC134543010 n=1 Tax=Bacillus rossius redtenbacheri TaxID=93214 RepID=UPI002FDDC88F
MCRAVMSALSLLLVLVAAVGPGGAIRCYTCSSDRDVHCADPLDRSRVQPVECNMEGVQRAVDSLTATLQGVSDRIGTQLFPHGDVPHEVPMVCQKIDLVGPDGRNHTARLCSLKDLQHGDLCQDFQSRISPQMVTYCGVCEDDGCNGAGGPPPPARWLAAALLPPAAAALLRRG